MSQDDTTYLGPTEAQPPGDGSENSIVQKEDRALWTVAIDRAAIPEAAHEG